MPGKLIVDEIEDSGGTSVIGRKNFIINGGMLVSQRGTSFASPSSTDYTLDRWQNTYSQDTGATTISQSTTTPDFFGSSLKIDCTTAETSVDAGNYWVLRQSFEGQDLQNLGYGTSNAKSITISFWVYSTKTGTFAVSLYNADAAFSYVADVTVDSASTWEKKTVTIAGDTANGFDNDNARSLILNITLNAGSTFQTTAGSWTSGAYFGTSNTDNFLDNTANEFFITGVQMEVGSVATDFEVRPIAEELTLCKRYYQKFVSPRVNYLFANPGIAMSTSSLNFDIPLDTEMRIQTDGTSGTVTKSGDFGINAFASGGDNTSGVNVFRLSKHALQIDMTKASSTLTNYNSYYVSAANGASLAIDVEL